MTTLATAPPSPRIHYLDSVRGLAALAVVFYHFFGWRWSETLKFHLASIIFNGSDAVSLFFVLSGLVLSWKYFYPNTNLVIDGPHYRDYVVNRIVRLYLPFVAALLLIYYYLNHHHGDNVKLLMEFITNEFHWMEEAVLIRGKHDMYGPGWTLEVEMAVSLLIPFLVLLLRYSRQLFLTLIGVSVVLGAPFMPWQIIHFMLGMVLTYYFPKIVRYNLKNSKIYPLRYLLYLVVFGLFSIRHITRIYPFGELTNYWLGMLRLDIFLFTGIGSFLILAYIINSPRLQRWLTVKPLLFLGRISYSVYLVHWYFVDYGISLINRFVPYFPSYRVAVIAVLACTVTATIIVATVFNILIERPSIRLGKRLSRHLIAQRSLTTSATQ